jgi:CDP-diacylglycerol---serine O-phosphatidyltransferase
LRFAIGPVGIKDLFTLINLMGGVFGVYFVMDHHPLWAGVSVMAGYLFGDALDGVVARLTHTSNRFGSELDTATDHFVQAIVPGLIVFEVYSEGGHRVLGLVILSIVITCATTRQALFTAVKMGEALTYCGLPRTVSGFASMSFVLSGLFFGGDHPAFIPGAVLISSFAIMGLLPIPYMTHRGARAMQTWVKVLVLAFFVTPVAFFFVARTYTFDILFLWMGGYAALGWLPLSADERRAFFERYRAWAAEISKA